MPAVKLYLLRKLFKLIPFSELSHEMTLTVNHSDREYMVEIYVFDVTGSD